MRRRVKGNRLHVGKTPVSSAVRIKLPDAEARLAHAYAYVDAHRDLWVGLNMAGIEENGLGNPARRAAIRGGGRVQPSLFGRRSELTPRLT